MCFVYEYDLLRNQCYCPPRKPEAAPDSNADKRRLEALWLMWYHGQIPFYFSAFVCTRGRNYSKCTIDNILRLIFSGASFSAQLTFCAD